MAKPKRVVEFLTNFAPIDGPEPRARNLAHDDLLRPRNRRVWLIEASVGSSATTA